MKCFRHPDIDAVGVCKACYKGVCRECAVDLGHSLACSLTCEEEARQVNAQILASRKSIMAQKKNSYLFPTFFGASGVVFFIFGLMSSDPFGLTTVFGIVFLLLSIVYFYTTWKWKQDLEQENR